jgi:plasmid stabilization system protein ParE
LIEGVRFYRRAANTELGNAFISEFERSVRLLLEYPRLGAKWRGDTRRLPLRRFPYSIFYEVGDAEVRVLAVAHQSRKPDFWRGRGSGGHLALGKTGEDKVATLHFLLIQVASFTGLIKD